MREKILYPLTIIAVYTLLILVCVPFLQVIFPLVSKFFTYPAEIRYLAGSQEKYKLPLYIIFFLSVIVNFFILVFKPNKYIFTAWVTTNLVIMGFFSNYSVNNFFIFISFLSGALYAFIIGALYLFIKWKVWGEEGQQLSFRGRKK